MVPFFPKQISSKAFYLYMAALVLVSVVFIDFSMAFVFILLGIMWVAGFFFITPSATVKWTNISQKKYVNTIFWTALALRLAWVTFSYFFYLEKTGAPFEFEAGD